MDLTSHSPFVCLSETPDKQDAGFNTQGLPILVTETCQGKKSISEKQSVAARE